MAPHAKCVHVRSYRQRENLYRTAPNEVAVYMADAKRRRKCRWEHGTVLAGDVAQVGRACKQHGSGVGRTRPICWSGEGHGILHPSIKRWAISATATATSIMGNISATPATSKMGNQRHSRDKFNAPGSPRVASARTVQKLPMVSAMMDVAIARVAGAARWLRLEPMREESSPITPVTMAMATNVPSPKQTR